MTTKRRKLTNASELPAYHSFQRGELNGRKGYYYTLCERLTVEDDLTIRRNYNNVVVCHASKEYAPEIQSNVLFVADKVIK